MRRLSEQKTSELMKKTRRIEIKTSRLVNELFGGRYLSTFKGRGMEFSDIRQYNPGDDIRDIHWKVTARLGETYVKRYTEERELTINIVVDVSQSLGFGTTSRFKSELAAELVALLTFSSIKNNDKVGLLLFSDKVEGYIPPRKSKSHSLRMIRDVLGFEPTSKGTDLSGALQYLNRVQKKRSIVFLISDFLSGDFEKSLRITKRRHDTIALVLEDRMEATWPNIGRILVKDAESGEQRWVNFNSGFLRDQYSRQSQSSRKELNKLFDKLNIDHISFSTEGDFIKPLMTFFKSRTRRK